MRRETTRRDRERHDNAFAHCKPRVAVATADGRTNFDDLVHELVAHDIAVSRAGHEAVEQVQIRTADRATHSYFVSHHVAQV